MDSVVTDQIRENAEVTSENDSFGYQQLAECLFAYIKDKNKVSPISVGIYGKWGTGKSVLGNFLKHEAMNAGLQVVEIDAMEFQGQDQGIFEYFLYKVGYKILGKQKFKEFLGKHGKKVGASLSWIIGRITGIEIPSLGEVFSSFDNREKELERLINAIKKKELEGLVLIDNLDRLQPRETIEFLEKLKAFFLNNGKQEIDNFAYVVLCDFDVLEGEVRSIYGDAINVRDYLNKLIEVPFYLPPLNADTGQKFIEKLLNPDIKEPMPEKIYSMLVSIAGVRTPRDIKLFLMELDMVFVVAKAKGEAEDFLIENLNAILFIIILKARDRNALEFLQNRGPSLNTHDTNKMLTDYYRRLTGIDDTSATQIRNLGIKTKDIVEMVELMRSASKCGLTTNNNQIDSDLFRRLVKIVDSSGQEHTKGTNGAGALGVGAYGVTTFGASTFGGG